MAPDDGLLTITAAYTGMRWGELAGLQWSRTYLGDNPRIVWGARTLQSAAELR